MNENLDDAASDAADRPKPVLSLFSSASIIVGVIVGVGIYETVPAIAGVLHSSQSLFLLWFLGGAASLCGALCYAELATAYPRQGGEYVYLTRAYGSWAGFLFGLVNLAVIRPGSIAAMSFPFARYMKVFFDPLQGTAWEAQSTAIYALCCIGLLTAVNIFGLRSGIFSQNILTVLKAAGLVLIIVPAFWHGEQPLLSTAPVAEPNTGLALILILFCYGGWQEICYVAAEVREPKKNLVRSMVLGTLCVALLYIAANAAFVRVLGMPGLRESSAVAADALRALHSPSAGVWIAVLICISTLAAVNALIFTGARIFYAMALDHPLVAALAKWNPRFKTPARSLLLQAVISGAIVLYSGSFTDTLVYTTTVVWTFFLLAAAAVVILRVIEPDTERPYRIHFYPLPVLVFSAACIYVVYSAFLYNPPGSLFSVAVMLLGLPLYAWSKRLRP